MCFGVGMVTTQFQSVICDMRFLIYSGPVLTESLQDSSVITIRSHPGQKQDHPIYNHIESH